MRAVNHLILVCLAFVLAGCATGPFEAQTKSPDLENTDVFVTLDGDLAHKVTCAGVLESRDPQARLQVVGKIQNLTNQRLDIEVDCVFKDKDGFPTGEVVPFGVLYLSANSQEQARFAARDQLASKYTIRVRNHHD